MKMNKAQRIKRFKQWIPTQVGDRKMLHSAHTANQYIKALEELSKLPIAKANLGEDHDVLGDAAASCFSDEVELAFLTDPDFKALNDNVNYRGVYSAALRKYRMFLAWCNGTPDDNEFWNCLAAGFANHRREEFVRWMRKQTSDRTHKLYSRATVESYESHLRCGGFRGFDFFAIDNAEDLAKMLPILEATKEYRDFSETDHNALSSALAVYSRFLGEYEL